MAESALLGKGVLQWRQHKQGKWRLACSVPNSKGDSLVYGAQLILGGYRRTDYTNPNTAQQTPPHSLVLVRDKTSPSFGICSSFTSSFVSLPSGCSSGASTACACDSFSMAASASETRAVRSREETLRWTVRETRRGRRVTCVARGAGASQPCPVRDLFRTLTHHDGGAALLDEIVRSGSKEHTARTGADQSE